MRVSASRAAVALVLCVVLVVFPFWWVAYLVVAVVVAWLVRRVTTDRGWLGPTLVAGAWPLTLMVVSTMLTYRCVLAWLAGRARAGS